VATGERLTTLAEFAPLLQHGAAAILQPATGRVGGLWQARKIAALAEAANAQVAPHLYAGPVEWAANVHLAATLPNLLMVETIETGGAFHRALIGDAIAYDEGYLLPPVGPGLGIEIDEALARAHPYKGGRLHLEMQEGPCDYSRQNRFGGGAPPETAGS
jgi:L-alanine-DL-glutamate epimerase-like enolase superfamily enzyme